MQRYEALEAIQFSFGVVEIGEVVELEDDVAGPLVLDGKVRQVVEVEDANANDSQEGSGGQATESTDESGATPDTSADLPPVPPAVTETPDPVADTPKPSQDSGWVGGHTV